MIEKIKKTKWETIAALCSIFCFITGYRSLPEVVEAVRACLNKPNWNTFTQIFDQRVFLLFNVLSFFFIWMAFFKDERKTNASDQTQEENFDHSCVFKLNRNQRGYILLVAYIAYFFCVAFFNDAGSTKGPGPMCGDIVELGSYKQSRNLNGNWGVSAINWIVLDVTEDKVLPLSKDGLFYRAFSENSNSSWDSSSLRSWLNQEFVQTAFSDEELSIIVTNNETSDFVFCLSSEQVLAYLPSANERICTPTAYAMSICESNPVSPGGKRPVPSYDGDYWWITDKGESGARFQMNVRGNGEINRGGTICTYSGIMVRPVIWVSYEGLTTILEERETN